MKRNIKKHKKKAYFLVELVGQIKTNRRAFAVFAVLLAAVITVMIRAAFQKNWENVFIGILAAVLFMIPPFIEKNFRIKLPTTLQIIVFIFIFCAEILGEIECYYVRVPMWDVMLHTVNGFIFAAFGFCLVDILNSRKKYTFKLSPLYCSVVAFCFSMTIGILWEFFEFGMDSFFATDMQKDMIVKGFSSVTFDATASNIPVHVNDIVATQIYTAGGESYSVSGYLDIGLVDTMKDLLVNFIGAVVFSFIGFFYVKRQGDGIIARQFIPVAKRENEDNSVNEENEENS